MREAILRRTSRRTFTGEAFSEAEQEKIRELVAAANAQSGLSIEFVEDGSVAFNSARKTYGFFKNVRSVLLMKGDRALPDLAEKVGYFGESLILDLTDLGYGTCWVGGTYDKRAYSIPDSEKFLCVIVLGKTGDVTSREKLLRNGFGMAKRKPLSERIDSAVELPDWVREGMEAVRLAPSAVNSQKPHFSFDGERVTASVPAGYGVDLGIAKCHFDQCASDYFKNELTVK